MSLWAHLAMVKEHSSEMDSISEVFDGNLCRCTGYRPILDAATKVIRIESNENKLIIRYI